MTAPVNELEATSEVIWNDPLEKTIAPVFAKFSTKFEKLPPPCSNRDPERIFTETPVGAISNTLSVEKLEFVCN